MKTSDKRKLYAGTLILIAGYTGLSAVSFVLVTNADMDTATGRHLLAGALANGVFCFTQIMITYFALRKGEHWAWWSICIPAFVYGLVMLITYSLLVSKERLFITIAPQIAGLFVLSLGLFYSGIAIFKNQTK